RARAGHEADTAHHHLADIHGFRPVACIRAGRVAISSAASQPSACSREAPHIAGSGCSATHMAGRSGRPNSAQRTPVGLPCGMPGIGMMD
ncbi:hypothetical protein B2A_03837, partial [mine drainage metagenome]